MFTAQLIQFRPETGQHTRQLTTIYLCKATIAAIGHDSLNSSDIVTHNPISEGAPAA